MFFEELYPEMLAMFSANVFRVLSPPDDPNAAAFDPEEDEPVMEVAWPHMESVYVVFMSFISHAEFQTTTAKKYFDSKFVDQLLDLFDSLDPHERDRVKALTHRVYGKMHSLRVHMRKAMNNTLLRFVYETESHNGVSEILDIYGSIINGFALPLKKEHTSFLFQILLPLYKVKSLPLFQPQLSYCVKQFIEKDVNLAEKILDSIIKYWPRVNSPKEASLGVVRANM